MSKDARTATFDPSRYVLLFWATPEVTRQVSCETLAQALRLIYASGVEQALRVTVWPD